MFQVRIALYYFCQLIVYMIFARAILSWFIRDQRNPIVQILSLLTEPILGPIRKLMFKLKIGGSMLDFSPIVAMLLLQWLSIQILSF